MEPKEIFRQMIEFNKTTLENSFNAMVMVQEQTEKMVSAFVDQAPWLPEEGKRVLRDWIDTYKKGRDDFKKIVDDSFKRVQEFFGEVK